MNDNILKIRTLLDRFFDGDTTLDEEQQLYAFFRDCRELPEDMQPLRDIFLDLAAVQQKALTPEYSESPEIHAVPISSEKEQPRRLGWFRWVAAAAVALLLVGGAATIFTNRSEAEEEYVAYIYGERTTDRAVVLDEMQKTMTALATTDGSDIVEEQLRSMFAN